MAGLIPFCKYEGLGNDFVLIDDPYGRVEIAPALAAAICDRRLGIGADGLLVVAAPQDPTNAGRMLYWNRDGTRAEMCGNGVRCVAKHLRDRHGIASASFAVETDAGPVRCAIREETPALSHVEVEMAAPAFGLRAAGMTPPQQGDGFARTLGDREFRFVALSVGNPHAVTFDAAPPADREALGPMVEGDPAFPARLNVGFARLAGPAEMSLDVFERGCGFTRACGTGACAAVAAACRGGRVPWGTPVAVSLPGGLLRVTAPGPDLPILMIGPARRVFEGTFVARRLEPGPRPD